MKMRRIAATAAAALMLPLALTGCGGDETPAAAENTPGTDQVNNEETAVLSIVTSFYPLQFVAQQVGGDLVEVTNLTPPAADPHNLELSPAATRVIGEADVVFYLAGFQAAVDQAIEARQPQRVVNAADYVTLLTVNETGGHDCSDDHDHADAHGHSHDHGHSHAHQAAYYEDDEDCGCPEDHAHSHGHDHAHGHSHGDDHGHGHEDESHAHYERPEDYDWDAEAHADYAIYYADEDSHDSHDGHTHDIGGYDPHFWLDPTKLAELAHPLAAALADAAPEHAEIFEANATDLVERLNALDEEFATALAPLAGAKLITNHTAFGYLAHRYGLEQIGVTGIDHDIEPSPARMREIRELAAEHNVTTLFYETLISPAVMQTLASDLGIDVRLIDTLEGLTQDGIDAGDDYFSIMRRNLDALVEGLNVDN